MNFRRYPSKLLLFGEYTVIKGGEALAIAFPQFYGSWIKDRQRPDPVLLALLKYLQDLANQKKLIAPLDLEAFQRAIVESWRFQSNIPYGYGLGSSGALSAAIYESFLMEQNNGNHDLVYLKKALGQIESFFHGSSSGMDPLICFLNKSILVEGPHQIRTVKLPEQGNQQSFIFLLNTGIQRKSEPIINWFVEQCEDHYFYSRCLTELTPFSSEAIDSYLRKDLPTLKNAFHQISHFQFKYFKPMILEAHRSTWLKCLASDFCKLKVCGAGGGGFILGYTDNFEDTKTLLKEYELVKVFQF